MSQIILVRHGQASFFGPTYDQLSAIGREQSRALGEYWVRTGVSFDHVFVGPRQRHLDTEAEVARVFKEHGLPWPRATLLPDLDEHQGGTVVKHQLGRTDIDNDALHPGEIGDGDRQQIMRGFARHFIEILGAWSRAEVVVPEVETWDEFYRRSLRVLDLLCATRPGERVVAFTSGGLICATLGWLLDLRSDRMIELMLIVRNTSLMEIKFSARRRNVVSFNGLPHLSDPALATAL